MRFANKLPLPTPEMLAHSNDLVGIITNKMQQSTGSLPFYSFMNMALYEPTLGYYVAGIKKLGSHGDFTTAPEISPLFSQCIANQCLTMISSEVQADILEIGAGSGIMAADILIHLEKQNALPRKYLILDLSPDLQQRQFDTLTKHAPHLVRHVEWISTLPTSFTGIILANEVLDAMPVELFSIEYDTVHTLHVTTNTHTDENRRTNEPFNFKKTPANHATQQLIKDRCLDYWDEHHAGYRPQEPYTSEFNPALSGWISSLSDTLEKGMILLIDYGYERSHYYHPERHQGTLLCHYQHHVHDNPLLWPGLQDITASVDFTAVAESADNAGLTVAAYQHQNDFLITNNLEALFSQALHHNPQQQYQLAQQVRTLTLPAEMGERFKVMTLTKGFTLPAETLKLANFSRTDQRHRL